MEAMSADAALPARGWRPCAPQRAYSTPGAPPRGQLWRARSAPPQPDDGLAMHHGDGDHFVQKAALVVSTAEGAIALALPACILPKTRSRHGHARDAPTQ